MRIFSHLNLHPTVLVAVVMMVLSFLLSGSNANDVVGVLDGTHKVTVEDIRSGLFISQTNHISPCSHFDAGGDKFVLTVEMGNFSDHLIPKEGVTLCDLLTSTTAGQKYVYAPMSPFQASWDGHTARVTPSLYDNALGGSAEGYVSGGRSTLSFWGDTGSNAEHTGGCCALFPGDDAAWYRPYRLLYTQMNHTMYLAWGTEPKIAVTNGPVFFEVNVWNMRSEPFNGSVTFDITINGKRMTVTSPTGRYAHYADVPDANTTKYNITVDLLSGPPTVNTNQLSVELDVLGKLPWDVTPFTDAMIPDLVHFGELGTAIGPVDKDAALKEDWFAVTVMGGESTIRPIAGHYNTVNPHTLSSTKKMWKNVTAENGVFWATVPCQSVQYYAVAVYSAVDQRIVVEYEYDTAAVVYFSGKRFLSHESKRLGRESFDVQVTKGYHQVLVKLFSSNSSATNTPSCTTNSKFSMRVVGTAIGYTHAVMPDLEESDYEWWTNHYMFYLLHSGAEKNDFLYGGLDEDFIGVRTAVPKPGDPVGDNVWKQLVFYGGQIPVSAEKLPKDKEAAVSYVAFAVFNGYETQIPLAWTFITGGHTDFYIDGVLVYSRSSQSGSLKKRFTTPVLPGWHECIVRIAATKGQSWALTFYIHFDNYRVGGASFPGGSLPLGVASVRRGAPLASMMELIDSESGIGAIPFDPSHESAANDTFTDLPIDARYAPGLLSMQRLNVLGEERKFQWVGVQSLDGAWGGRAFGGNFIQYWAVVLYAAEAVKTMLHITFHGGYAMWLNGAVVGSAPLSASKEGCHTVELNKGWSQVIVKLKANNSFHLIDSRDRALTWTKANAVCSGAGGMKLCPLSAVCPLGVGRPGAIPLSGDSSFLPVSDAKNEWVQVSAHGGNDTALCQTWRETHGDQSPFWGEANVNLTERHFVPCCGGNLPPSMSLSITPPLDAKGKVGYTYEIPVIIEAPVITLNSTVALTKMVTITSATPNAVLKYAIDDAEKMTVYSGPFEIKQSVTIIAQAFAQDRESRQTRLFVVTPDTPSVDRVTCVSNNSCPLLVSGVDPGWRISILSLNSPSRSKRHYLNLTFAEQQNVSSNFSGVLMVDANNTVVVPPLGTGMFYVIAYNSDGRGAFLSHHLTYRATQLGPSDVVGTQHTPFHIKGGVMRGDAVLLPFGPTESPVTCDANACLAEFNQKPDRIDLLSSDNEAIFWKDMYGYAGNLSCLCLCLSCPKVTSDPPAVLIEPSKVVAQTVMVRVSRPSVPGRSFVEAVRPSVVRDGDVLEMDGAFVTSSRYSVHFTPMTPEGGQNVVPQCTILDVQTSVLRCKMRVQAGTMGTWNISLMDGTMSVVFAEEAVWAIAVHPPRPVVETVTGSCAAASSGCVTGAQLTFHGANFNPLQPSYNDVVVGEGTAAWPIQCLVVTVNKTELVCDLNIPRDKEHGTYPLAVRVQLSKGKWDTAQSAGFLLLGAGTDVPGWKQNEIPPLSEGGENVLFTLSVVLGLLLLALIVAFGVLVARYRTAVRESETEMNLLEMEFFHAPRDNASLLNSKEVVDNSERKKAKCTN